MDRRLGDAPRSHDGRIDGAWFSSQHPQCALSLGTVAARRILLRRNRLQMVGVDAGTIAAEVVHHQPGRNWSSIHLIVVTMSRDLLVVTSLEGVALDAQISLPDPAARIGINPIVDRRKPFDEFAWVGLAGSGVPHLTVTAR